MKIEGVIQYHYKEAERSMKEAEEWERSPVGYGVTETTIQAHVRQRQDKYLWHMAAIKTLEAIEG